MAAVFPQGFRERPEVVRARLPRTTARTAVRSEVAPGRQLPVPPDRAWTRRSDWQGLRESRSAQPATVWPDLGPAGNALRRTSSAAETTLPHATGS